MGVLPVTLVAFGGDVFSSQVKLTWTTAQESQNAYFRIYHSTDGQSFKLLKEIPGAGDSDQPQTYSYLHQFAASGSQLYRLTQTDYDGTTVVLGTRQVFVEGKAEAFTLVPNPAQAGQALSIDQLPEQAKAVLLINTLGQQWPLSPQEGRVQLPAALSPGLYFVRIPGEASARLSALIIE